LKICFLNCKYGFYEILSAFGGYARFFLKKIAIFQFSNGGAGDDHGYLDMDLCGFFNFCVFVAFTRSCAPFQALPSFILPLLTLFCGVFPQINVSKAGLL
jgi:hypothetical protein